MKKELKSPKKGRPKDATRQPTEVQTCFKQWLEAYEIKRKELESNAPVTHSMLQRRLTEARRKDEGVNSSFAKILSFLNSAIRCQKENSKDGATLSDLPDPLSAKDFWLGPDLWKERRARPLIAGEEASESDLSSAVMSDHLSGYLNELHTRLSQAETAGDFVVASQLSDSIATAYETTQMWQDAIPSLNGLVELARKCEDRPLCYRTLSRLGVAHYRVQEHRQAFKRLMEARKILKGRTSCRSPLRYDAKLMDYVGLVLLRLKRAKWAQRVFEKYCIPQSGTFDDTRLRIASVKVRIGIAQIEQGKFDKAKRSIIEGLRTRFELNALTDAARSLHNLGLLHYRIGQPDNPLIEAPQALLAFQVCLCWQEGLGDVAGRAKTHFYIGQIYRRLYEGKTNAKSPKIWDRIVVELSSSLFPDDEEREIIERMRARFVSRRFQGRVVIYRHDYNKKAHHHFSRCVELAMGHCGRALIDAAQNRLNSLSKEGRD